MVRRIPFLYTFVQEAFEIEPGLLKKTMEVQAMRLIVEPLNIMAPEDRSQYPYVILLDGLDEISGVTVQQAILKTIAFINDHLHTPLHFLIASRPEPPIHQAFDELMPRR